MQAKLACVEATPYHACMSTLLMNLRQVPDDEADGVRAMLNEAGIAFYETKPSLWGVSHGGIWLGDGADLPAARALLAQFQTRRRDSARAEREAARRDGTAESIWTTLRRHPLRVVLILLAVAFFAALTAWPFLLL